MPTGSRYPCPEIIVFGRKGGVWIPCIPSCPHHDDSEEEVDDEKKGTVDFLPFDYKERKEAKHGAD